MNQENSTTDDGEYLSIAELENLLPKIVAAHDSEKKKRKWWMAGTFIAALVFGAGGIGVAYHVTVGQQEKLREEKSRLFEEKEALKTTKEDLEKNLERHVKFVEGIGNVVYPTLSAIFDHSFKPTIELCSLNQDDKAPYFRCEEGKAEIKKQVDEYQNSDYPGTDLKIFAGRDTSIKGIISGLTGRLEKMVQHDFIGKDQKSWLSGQLKLLKEGIIYFKRTNGGKEEGFIYKKPAEGEGNGTLEECDNGKTKRVENPGTFFADNAVYKLLENYACQQPKSTRPVENKKLADNQTSCEDTLPKESLENKGCTKQDDGTFKCSRGGNSPSGFTTYVPRAGCKDGYTLVQ